MVDQQPYHPWRIKQKLKLPRLVYGTPLKVDKYKTLLMYVQLMYLETPQIGLSVNEI